MNCEDAVHQRRKLRVTDAFKDLACRATARHVQFLATARRLRHALFGDFRTAFVEVVELLQVDQQAVEDAHVVVEIVQQLLDD